MLENIVDSTVRPIMIYSIVSTMGYIVCVRNSIEYNNYITDWRDHFRIGFHQFQILFQDAKFHIIPGGYVLYYYADKILSKLAPGN